MGEFTIDHLINDRWLRIPEDDIYRLYVARGVAWGQKEIYVGNRARYYLSSDPYTYPYSLPPEVIGRLAIRLNEGRLMFDHGYWLNEFEGTPGWNDTGGQVTVETPEGVTWVVMGVHKLLPSEALPHPAILFDVRCKTGNRDGMKPVYFEWEGMQPHEKPGPAFVDKPPYEVGNIGIIPDVGMSVWVDNGGRASGFREPDSYFIVFQEVEPGTTPPDPPDPPDLEAKGTMEFRIDAAYFNSLPVDEHNMVRVVVPIYP